MITSAAANWKLEEKKQVDLTEVEEVAAAAAVVVAQPEAMVQQGRNGEAGPS